MSRENFSHNFCIFHYFFLISINCLLSWNAHIFAGTKKLRFALLFYLHFTLFFFGFAFNSGEGKPGAAIKLHLEDQLVIGLNSETVSLHKGNPPLYLRMVRSLVAWVH